MSVLKSHRLLLSLLGIAVAHESAACAASSGVVADATCTVVEPFDRGELYVSAVGPQDPTGTDLWFEPESKGEPRVHVQTILSGAQGWWCVGDPWRVRWSSTCVSFAAITLPEGRVMLDSGTQASPDFGAAIAHRVGDSLPVGEDAGIGLTIPGTRSRYHVGSGSLDGVFPQRTSGAGIRIAFAPLPEVNGAERGPHSGCSHGGGHPDPLHPLAPGEVPTLGHVAGYNVFRIPACPLTVGDASEFGAALADGSERSGWVGYVDLLSLDPNVAHDGAVSPGPNDRDWGDAAELINPDGIMYSGDEVVVFTDLGATARPEPWRAPRADQDYWYAVQPVWRGDLNDFAATGFLSSGEFYGDHRIDLDGDGRHDAIDLHDGTTTPEFISPQAEPENGGHGGLGLTHAGLPLVGPPMYAPRAFTTASPGECAVVPPGPVRPPTRPPFRVP